MPSSNDGPSDCPGRARGAVGRPFRGTTARPILPRRERFRRALQLWGHLGDAGGQRPGGRFQQVGRLGRRLRGQLGHRRPHAVRRAPRRGGAAERRLPARPTTTWRRRSPVLNTTGRNLAFGPGSPAGGRFRLLAGEAAVPEWEWPDRFGTRRWPAKPSPPERIEHGFMVQLPCCATGNATLYEDKTQRKGAVVSFSVRMVRSNRPALHLTACDARD